MGGMIVMVFLPETTDHEAVELGLRSGMPAPMQYTMVEVPDGTMQLPRANLMAMFIEPSIAYLQSRNVASSS